MLIASEASMRTAFKGGVALKTAPLSSGAIVDRRFVSITTKRERYSLDVSLPLFMSTHLKGIGFIPFIRSNAKTSVDNFPNVQVHDEVVHLLDPSLSHQGWLKCKTSEVIKELSLGSGSPRASAGIRFRGEYRRFLFRSSLLQCRPRFNLAEVASTR